MTVSYKIFKEKGIDIFKYLRDEKKAYWCWYSQILSRVARDRQFLIPILEQHFPSLVKEKTNKIGEVSKDLKNFIHVICKFTPHSSCQNL